MENGVSIRREWATSLAKNRVFLGREFLTYLWFIMTTKEKGFAVDVSKLAPETNPDERAYLSFEKKLVMSGLEAEAAIKNASPTMTREAVSALREGRLVSEAGVALEVGDYRWTFSLKAADLTPRGVMIPKRFVESLQPLDGDSAVDHEELFMLRLEKNAEAIQEIHALIETHFNRYLSLREDTRTMAELKAAMQQWSSELRYT